MYCLINGLDSQFCQQGAGCPWVRRAGKIKKPFLSPILLCANLWAKCSHRRRVSSLPDQNHKKEPLAFHTFVSLFREIVFVPPFPHSLFSS